MLTGFVPVRKIIQLTSRFYLFIMSSEIVKKQTMYLVAAFALLAGFLAGVLFSVYRSPGLVMPGGMAGQQAGQHMEQRAQALASLEQAAQARPDDVLVWTELGHAYFDAKQTVKAIAAYTRALELQPGNTEVMTDLGVMYHENHEHERAIALFEEVLQARPEHAQARFNKGVVLLTGLNRPKEAIEQWRILLQYHPKAASATGESVRDLIRRLEAQMAAQTKDQSAN